VEELDHCAFSRAAFADDAENLSSIKLKGDTAAGDNRSAVPADI
jgi:hypothetical protein